MPKRLATILLLSGVILATASCESSQQKETKRINALNVENCLMKKEDTVYCDRVNPELTSEELMKQVKEQKGIIVKDLEVKKNVEECLDNSLIDSCKNVDTSHVPIKTQNAISKKIGEIQIDKCVTGKEMVYCKQIDLSSTDKDTEASVLKTIETIETEQEEAAAVKKAEEFQELVGILELDDDTKANKAIVPITKSVEAKYPPAEEYMSTLNQRWRNGDKKAIRNLVKLSNNGSKEAKAIIDKYNAEKEKASAPKRKSKQAALREICEAGAEYSRDGYGTQQQIAHELAYWVIDLYKQTGGAASEGQLKNAGAHGYMYENCSKY